MTRYHQFADEAAARAALSAALGFTFDPDAPMTGARYRFSLVAPIDEWVRRPTIEGAGPDAVVADAGESRTGFWSMIRINPAWSGADAAIEALAPYEQTLETPFHVFGEE